jgi:AraC family transcriptional regulator of arabinose operon
MDEWLKPLIQRAFLEIVEYDYQIRTEMLQTGRDFPFCVMSYLKSGEALLRVGEKEYCCKAGDAIFIPPHVVHDHIKTSKEEAVFLWWHFNFRTAYNMDVMNLMKLPYRVHMENYADFEDKFFDYIEAIKNEKTIADMIYKNAKALEVLACLFDSFLHSQKTQMAPDIPNNFIEIFNEISGKPRADLTLGMLGEKYHMNPTYISNKFKVYFGVSPIVLQRNMLFERAKDYLVSSSMSVNEIAEELMFSDHAVFTRFFTERAGVAPKKYRNISY